MIVKLISSLARINLSILAPLHSEKQNEFVIVAATQEYDFSETIHKIKVELLPVPGYLVSMEVREPPTSLS